MVLAAFFKCTKLSFDKVVDGLLEQL